MAIKKKKYISFYLLVKKFDEPHIVSTFYIIYHKIIKNSLNDVEILFYLDILFKYNLNLYLIKNIKDGITVIKKYNNFIYKYLYNKYKQQKYENKLNELLDIYKDSNGTISKLLVDINNIFNDKLFVQNNINKINKIIDSFNDKKFIISINSLNNNNLKIDINNIKIININEIQNRLFFLINIFGIVSLKKMKMNIMNVKKFNKLNYNNKIEYYESCINILNKYNDNLKNTCSLYLDTLFHINLLQKKFNMKYNNVIDYCVKNTINSIIDTIEKN